MLLYSTTSGTGPHLILLHGLFASGNNWGSIVRRIERVFTVTAFDLRNHGRSPWSDRMDHKVMAEDVADTMDSLMGKPAWVVGHSMGGKVGMELAVGRPALVEGLVIEDVASRAYEREHDAILRALNAVDPGSLTTREQADVALRTGIPDTAVRHFLLTNLKRTDSGTFCWRMNLEAITACYGRLLEEAARGGHYEGPTLVVSGGRSHHVRATDEPLMRRKFPRCVFRQIPGAGHWVHADAPEEFVAHLLRFTRGDI